MLIARRSNLTRLSALRNRSACAALLIAASSYGLAQNPAIPETARGAGAAGAAGAVIVPPVSDPGMVKQAPPMPGTSVVKPPPVDVGSEAVRKPRKDEGGDAEGSATKRDAKPDAAKQSPQVREGAGRSNSRIDKSKAFVAVISSVKDNCKGAAALCRQGSVR